MSTATDEVIIVVSDINPAYIKVIVRFDVYRPVYGSSSTSGEDIIDYIVDFAYDVSAKTYLEGDVGDGSIGWNLMHTAELFSIDMDGDLGSTTELKGFAYNWIDYNLFIPSTRFPDDWTNRIKVKPRVSITDSNWPVKKSTYDTQPVIGLGLSLNDTHTAVEQGDTGNISIEAYNYKSIITGTDVLITDPITDKITLNYTHLINDFLVPKPNQPPTINVPSHPTDMYQNDSITVGYNISDPDDSNSNLNVTASSNRSSVTTDLNTSAKTVTVTSGNSTTNAEITLTVEDQDGATDTHSFTVGVINAGPTITAPNDQIITKQSSTGPLSFDVNDPDESNSNLNVTASAGSNLTVNVDNNNNKVSVSAGNNEGVSQVTLTVTDNDGATATDSFNVNVTNQGPQGFDRSITLIAGSSSTFINMEDANNPMFTDPDGDNLTYSVFSNNTSVDASITDSMLTLEPPNNEDSGTIKIQAIDDSGGTGRATLTIEVNLPSGDGGGGDGGGGDGGGGDGGDGPPTLQ